jgi:dienelactone hydrolase
MRRSPVVLMVLSLVVGLAAVLVAPEVRAEAGTGGSPGTGARAATAPVGVVQRTFVDRTRRTPADPSAGIAPDTRRVLPTTIYYPARGARLPGTVSPDAPPARGAHPLVLFAGGSPGLPEEYQVLLADWAAHGYVVVAPQFPVSSVSGPDVVAWKDLPAQTKDARFVLDRVLRLDHAAAGIPRIDDDRMAVAGHSFGGATALSLASKCCRDEVFDAVVALAAVTDPQQGPTLKRPAGPVLFVHARRDRQVAHADAAALCATASTPKRFLTVETIAGMRGHVVPYVGEGDAYSGVVRPAVVDFLDGYVRDDPAARRRLDAAATDPAVASLARCRAGDSPTARPPVTSPE